jgi:hypothetical protein
MWFLMFFILLGVPKYIPIWAFVIMFTLCSICQIYEYKLNYNIKKIELENMYDIYKKIPK